MNLIIYQILKKKNYLMKIYTKKDIDYLVLLIILHLLIQIYILKIKNV